MIVLFIGFGSIAKKHFCALKELFPTVRCFALRSSRNSDHIEGVTDVYTWEDIPSNITFAIVSTPTFTHRKDIEMLVERKIPMVLEKPISNSLEGLEYLSAKISKLSIPTYVACNLRFLPAIKFLRDQIQSGTRTINEVNVYAGSYLPSWRPGVDFRSNYSSIAEMGGGVHLDLFHELDYICWIFGFPETSFSIQRSVSSLKINSVDFASYSLIYPKYVATVLLNYYRIKPKRNIEVVFEDEIWEVDLLKNEIKNSEGNLIFQDRAYQISDTYRDQLEYVSSTLQNSGDLNLNSFEESLKILKICLTSYELRE